jgi:type II secretory ATPase GspE/PulE/Tfp pilus assembly ATPase PilB-like protein/ActR/RegA family two-component response regulator
MNYPGTKTKKAQHRKPVILAVDDDRIQHKFIERFLQNQNYELIFASSGVDAFEKLERITPDLILLDVMMPGMTGYEFCAQLQEDEDKAYIPVVFASSMDEQQDISRAFALGAVGYLIKPYNRDELIEKVSSTLKIADNWEKISEVDEDNTPTGFYMHEFKGFRTYLERKQDLSNTIRDRLSRLNPRHLYSALGEAGFEESVLARCIAEFLGLPIKAALNYEEVLPGILPTRFCKMNLIVPLKGRNSEIIFALSNPFDCSLTDVLERFTGAGKKISLMITEPDNIKWLFKQAEVKQGQKEYIENQIIIAPGPSQARSLIDRETKDIAESANEAPVIELADYILARAIISRASDVHLEPKKSGLGVRYRIDGYLYEQESVTENFAAALISRVKIMASLDIVERRLPQDGKIGISLKGRDFDLRVSTLPGRYGEKIVIRILDTSSTALGLPALGLEPSSEDLFSNVLAKNSGLILVTGPTGSGKTTTLYSALKNLNQPQRNIVTVEDPIEYEMERLTQVQVNHEIGMTFPVALRSLLRQDPDVIMIGEIRDAETADIATKAALTGHLVLSTLHTNDAPSTIIRLLNMGLESYLLAASIELIIAQRLLRKLCPHCKEETDLPENALKYYKIEAPQDSHFYKAVGCPVCNGTGYRGRLLAEQVLSVDDGIRNLINSSPDIRQIDDYATKEQGMMSLSQSGFLKAARGETTLDEVLRVTG